MEYLVNSSGKRLKYLLLINEISGSQLARKVKVHQPIISKIINNGDIPNEKKVFKALSEFFQVEEEWLTNGEISEHGCGGEFVDIGTSCFHCGKYLSDFIKERFWLRESEMELPLLNKLKLVKQYKRYIENIDITIDNMIKGTKDAAFTNVHNLSECENALSLKQRVLQAIEKLKEEFDKDCREKFTLEYYLDDRNWAEGENMDVDDNLVSYRDENNKLVVEHIRPLKELESKRGEL